MIRNLKFSLCALLLAFAAACHKSDPAPEPEPAARVQTLLMYFPWSGNLTAYFQRNIADMEKVVASDKPAGVRVLVFFMSSPSDATLYELRTDETGSVLHDELIAYPEAPKFTTAEGIASILEDVKRLAPAEHYALSIGSHGMGWIPAIQPEVRTSAGARIPHPAEREHWEVLDDQGRPLTRWFGGTSADSRTEITTLAEALTRTGIKMDYILFDDCYMSSIEVAYDLRGVTDFLIGSTCEVMAYGFPYADMGRYMLGEPDYAAICDAFIDFYSNYSSPYGTIGITDCSQLDALAGIMRRINSVYTFPETTEALRALQSLDGYSPTRFFDLGDYVRQLCGGSGALLDEFEAQLARTVPWYACTSRYYSANDGVHTIATFSGITTSDPSISSYTVTAKTYTAWWRATH